MTCVAFSPDDRVLVTGAFDGTIRLWDVEEQTPLGPPLETGHPVHALDLSTDGRVALTGGGSMQALLEGHGRVEERYYYICPVPDDLPGGSRWNDLKAIGIAISNTQCNGS